MRIVVPVIFLLGCPAEPKDVDSDGDGLLDSEEAELGTDPEATDSDEDGFDDKAEVDGGFSPLWAYSHPFDEGDYLVGACPTHPDESAGGPTGTGSYDTYTWDTYQEGDVMLNLVNTDQYGQEVSLYSFCGNYTVVTQAAEWCGPCQQLASTMSDEMEHIRETVPNFVFYEVLYQNNRGGNPNKGVLENWSDAFGLYGADDTEADEIPVVAPEDNTSEEMNWINATGSIPATLLVAPDMTVIWSAVNRRDYYLTTADDILDAIERHESGD